MQKNELIRAIESILFVSLRPLSVRKLALQLDVSISDTKEALQELLNYYPLERGIVLVVHNDNAQLVTNPLSSEIVRMFLKVDQTSDLTRSAIETLSIIAYRGPITKEEIEQIRGVNCSIALRNLTIRGLIESKEESQSGSSSYFVTFDFLRHLGINSNEHLPEFEYFRTQSFTNTNLSSQDNSL